MRARRCGAAGVSLCVGEQPRLLTGVNYFGFETTWGTMVDGIFNGPTALTIGMLTCCPSSCWNG